MTRKVQFKNKVVDSLLTYFDSSHPREGILLLRGKVGKDVIIVTDVMIPPLAIHGEGFSSFPLHTLPLDSSILGVAHSHPSGVLRPSAEDISESYGRLMVIVSYPYESDEDIGLFDSEGKILSFEII